MLTGGTSIANAVFITTVQHSVTQLLGEYQREDVVLVLGCILGTADGTGGIPYPRFEGFVFFFCHQLFLCSLLCKQVDVL